MKFKFHLFVQKHANRTYTVSVLPFGDLTGFGLNLDEIKAELGEAITERVRAMPPRALQHLEFDPRLTLQKVQVAVRPVDKKNAKKRREQIKMLFSVLVRPEDDGQLLCNVPKLGSPALTFYVYSRDEFDATCMQEISAWLDGASIEALMSLKHARSEVLDALEIDIPLKKTKEEREGLAQQQAESQFWALKEVGINMTAQASEGRFRKAYRRDLIVDDILKTLVGARHNSVLITGPSEVGKTAVVHEIVRRIQRKDCDEKLHDRQVWMLTPDRLIAGAQFIGTWEERINDIANECRVKQHILYVDDLPGLLEVGRWSKSDSNIAMALRPHIASGEVIMIGEASPERLTMANNAGASFINQFRVFTVDPLVEDETLSVLNNVARDLERELDLRVDPKAHETTVALTRRFLPYRSFPGKAIRLLEESVADANKGAPPRSDAPSLLRRIARITVDRRNVVSTFSRMSGMPEFVVNDEARLDIAEVAIYFRERIIGQDQAIDAMVNLVATIKAGLNDPKKPMGTFLFIGPTGVGKTEMAKTLAAFLFGDPARMIRFDMSEYNSVDGAARLIGAFNAEGELTRRVREQPFSVVLLDEFEKADPRIYDIFLQVLGEGRLTDSRGKTTSFHNAVIIMTSNLGTAKREVRPRGFVAAEPDLDEITATLEQHYRARIEGYFRPEFVNRIDQIVTFTQLSRPALKQIAAREMADILRRDGITRRNIPVDIADTVIDLVLEKGYSPVYGARPLKREIERLVVAPMARVLSERKGTEQHLLRLTVDSGNLQIAAVPIEEAPEAEIVTLTGAMSDADKQRMDVPAIVEGVAVLRRKLADWNSSDQIREMRKEKENLLEQTQKNEFWQNATDSREAMSRFYFVERLLARLAQLLERAEYLEDFAVMVNRERALTYQSDLARDYETLFQQVSYLDIELMTAHLPHRNQAMLLITPFGAQVAPGMLSPGANSDDWARKLAEMYVQWAERKGYDYDIYLLQPGANVVGGQAFARMSGSSFDDLLARFRGQPPTTEIAIYLTGTNVFGFLKGERGLHKWAAREAVNDQLAQVRVYAIPDNTNIGRWLRDYQTMKVEIAEGRRAAPDKEQYTVIRNYNIDRSDKYIRDLRTNLKVVRPQDILSKGLLDEFILAFLRIQETNVSWEDRFPPTFPF